MKCPNCNKEVLDGSKFSNNFGHKFEQENAIKCTIPDCGHTIPSDSKFCPDCGKKIVENLNPDSCGKKDDSYYYMPFIAPNGKCGIKDRRNGKIVIEAKYDFIDVFSEGVVRAQSCKKWGGVDIHGNVVVPFKYDSMLPFQDGLACVEMNGKNGYVDKSGKEVISMQYDFADSFSDGLAYVELDGTSYFIDKKGQKTISCNYDSDRCYSFNEGLAAVARADLWGFINKKGEEVIPCQYYYVEGFCEGVARVEDEEREVSFIDSSGKVVPSLAGAECFSEGLAAVERNGLWGFVDIKGQQVIPFEFVDVHPFRDGYASVARCIGHRISDGTVIERWGLIDKNGNEVIPFEYKPIHCHDGVAAVSKYHSKVYYLMDVKKGKILSEEFDYINGDSSGLFYVCNGEERGYLDVFGNYKSFDLN